jgi:hypothetical protein
MKASGGTLAAIVVLSLVVWTLVYVFNPSTPLTQAETVVVVGACAVVVFGFKWLVGNFRKTRGDNEPHA